MDATTLRQAIREAVQTMDAADIIADELARLLRGRLRHVSGSNCQQLKKELAEFNAQTHRWKN